MDEAAVEPAAALHQTIRVFAYRYVLRLGFLDGKEGFIFHFLQAFWYRLLVDINRVELRRTALHVSTHDRLMVRAPLEAAAMDSTPAGAEKKP
ncbi:MAG: hypothetical protein QM736_01690 [Vicinamibacterales bacterium]